MTRTYAARKLLEHGPLMRHQFDAITGWPPKECAAVLQRLRESRIAKCDGQHREFTVWRLR